MITAALLCVVLARRIPGEWVRAWRRPAHYYDRELAEYHRRKR